MCIIIIIIIIIIITIIIIIIIITIIIIIITIIIIIFISYISPKDSDHILFSQITTTIPAYWVDVYYTNLKRMKLKSRLTRGSFWVATKMQINENLYRLSQSRVKLNDKWIRGFNKWLLKFKSFFVVGFFSSETTTTSETVTGPINVSMSLAEYLKTKYDKTVRPNIDSGKKIAN